MNINELDLVTITSSVGGHFQTLNMNLLKIEEKEKEKKNTNTTNLKRPPSGRGLIVSYRTGGPMEYYW